MSTTSIRVSVFRDDLIADPGETVRITARLSDEIAHAFEAMRDRQWGRPRLKLTYGRRVVEGEAGTVRRTVRAGGSDEVEVEIELVRVQPPRPRWTSCAAGTSGLSADELVEAGMRALFIGEPLPPSLGMLDFMTDTGSTATTSGKRSCSRTRSPRASRAWS